MSHEKYTKIIETLNNCAIQCSHCAMACLGERNVFMMTDCIRLDIDCAEICRLVSSFASRGSIHAKHLMHECVEICNACADECEKHSQMEHCKKCAEICHQCSKECLSIE